MLYWESYVSTLAAGFVWWWLLTIVNSLFHREISSDIDSLSFLMMNYCKFLSSNVVIILYLSCRCREMLIVQLIAFGRRKKLNLSNRGIVILCISVGLFFIWSIKILLCKGFWLFLALRFGSLWTCISGMYLALKFIWKCFCFGYKLA